MNANLMFFFFAKVDKFLESRKTIAVLHNYKRIKSDCLLFHRSNKNKNQKYINNGMKKCSYHVGHHICFHVCYPGDCTNQWS